MKRASQAENTWAQTNTKTKLGDLRKIASEPISLTFIRETTQKQRFEKAV